MEIGRTVAGAVPSRTRRARFLASRIAVMSVLLDHAHRSAPRLEGAALPDPHHAPLDVGRILTDQPIAEMHDEGFQVRLVLLHLAVAADPPVGDDPHDRVLADDRAFEVDDFHGHVDLDHGSGVTALMIAVRPLRFRWLLPR